MPSNALTITEAAAALGVCRQRVSQMLRDGLLEGPRIGPGRAPKNAPRVWPDTLQAEIDRRRQQAESGRMLDGDARDSRDRRPASSASTAVLAMKVQLDTARDALRIERRTNQHLTRLLADAVAELQTAQEQSDRLDDIASGYSDALTQVGIPDRPPSVS